MSAITPREAGQQHVELIPSFIVDAVNDLLAASYNAKLVVLYQEDVVEAIIKRQRGLTERDLINRNWLDFEPLYRARGWKVEYFGEAQRRRWVFQPLES